MISTVSITNYEHQCWTLLKLLLEYVESSSVSNRFHNQRVLLLPWPVNWSPVFTDGKKLVLLSSESSDFGHQPIPCRTSTRLFILKMAHVLLCQISSIIHHRLHSNGSKCTKQIGLPALLIPVRLSVCVCDCTVVCLWEAWPIHSCAHGLINSCCQTSREVVQMKKRAWRWAGKPAMSQQRGLDTLSRAPLKESICQMCLRRASLGSTLVAEAPSGIGPLTPSYSNSPGWPPMVLPAVSGDRPSACALSIGSLIKQARPQEHTTCSNALDITLSS